VGDGIALFNYFDSYPLELHIYNTGSVASVAVTSFLGMPHRYASAHATFMIHRTRLTLPTPGDAATHRAIAANIEADDTRTEAIIRSRTTIPEDRWAAQAINDVTSTAQEPCNSDSFRRYASSGLRPAIRSSISESVIATDLLQFKLTPMENTLENAEKFAAKCPTQNRIGLLCSRKPPNKELNRSQVEPSLGAGERGLEVFRQAAVSIEPRQCAFDNPATGKHRKTRDIGAALDDFDRPVAKLGDRAVEPAASIGVSANRWRNQGNRSWMAPMTSAAPSRSCTSAGWISAPTSRPSVSVMIWRLRPLTFLPAS